MRLAAVILVSFTCWAAFAGDAQHLVTGESDAPPAAADSRVPAQVRQAEDSDLTIKEWHSPVAFDLDASWLRTLPPGGTRKIEDLPIFYCDGVTLDRMEVEKRLQPTTGAVEVKFKFHLRARKNIDGDKIVALEFRTLADGQPLLLGRRDELFIAEGDSESWSAHYMIPTDKMAEYAADGSHPLLRISMVVRND